MFPLPSEVKWILIGLVVFGTALITIIVAGI